MILPPLVFPAGTNDCCCFALKCCVLKTFKNTLAYFDEKARDEKLYERVVIVFVGLLQVNIFRCVQNKLILSSHYKQKNDA